jgi:nucleoside-diphosphate-sugar epimerase
MKIERLTYWRGRSVLVAGGCGFIGSRRVRELVRLGARVRVADNLSRGYADRLADVFDQIEFYKCDLCEAIAAERTCEGIDTVFNVAACSRGALFTARNHSRMLRENVLIQAQLLEASRRKAVNRFIFFSSACVYPRDAETPMSESAANDGPPSLDSWGYAWAKRVGELHGTLYRSEHGLRVTSLRPFNVCGTGEYYFGNGCHVIPDLIRKAESARRSIRVLGAGSQTRSFIDVTDLAKLTLIIAERGADIVAVNVASPREISISYLCRMVLQATGRTDLKIRFVPAGPTGAMRSVPDLGLLIKIVGPYEFTPLKDSIQRMVAEYRRLRCELCS